jgi:hypothetical protein
VNFYWTKRHSLEAVIRNLEFEIDRLEATLLGSTALGCSAPGRVRRSGETLRHRKAEHADYFYGEAFDPGTAMMGSVSRFLCKCGFVSTFVALAVSFWFCPLLGVDYSSPESRASRLGAYKPPVRVACKENVVGSSADHRSLQSKGGVVRSTREDGPHGGLYHAASQQRIVAPPSGPYLRAAR